MGNFESDGLGGNLQAGRGLTKQRCGAPHPNGISWPGQERDVALLYKEGRAFPRGHWRDLWSGAERSSKPAANHCPKVYQYIAQQLDWPQDRMTKYRRGLGAAWGCTAVIIPGLTAVRCESR